MAAFYDHLKDWVNQEVTVVNPESYKSTALGEGLTFQTFGAKLAEVGDDYIVVAFQAKKMEEVLNVEQIIPIHKIKRVSLWGQEKLIHI